MALLSDMELDQLVPLGAVVVPLATIAWLIDAEFRGLRFCLQPDGRVFAGPREAVTPGDLTFIRLNRADVIVALEYLAAAEARPQ